MSDNNRILIRKLNYHKSTSLAHSERIPDSKQQPTLAKVQLVEHKLTFLRRSQHEQMSTIQNFNGKSDQYKQNFFQTENTLGAQLTTQTDGYFYKFGYYKHQKIPDEQFIRTNYNFRLPVMVQEQENKGSDIHFLEAFPHTVELTENYVNNSKKNCEQLGNNISELNNEMKDLKQNIEDTITSCEDMIKSNVSSFLQRLKFDFISHTNNNFDGTKQVAILEKNKQDIEKEFDKSLNKVRKLESQIFGVKYQFKRLNCMIYRQKIRK